MHRRRGLTRHGLAVGGARDELCMVNQGHVRKLFAYMYFRAPAHRPTGRASFVTPRVQKLAPRL
jgi:hypothetical protein